MKPTRLLVLLLVGAAMSLPCLNSPVHAKPKPPSPKPPSPNAILSPTDSPEPPVRLEPLPAPWKSADIGKVGVPGGALTPQIGNHYLGIYLIHASGEDIFGKADSFHYAYQPLTGNGQIAVQVISYTRQDMWTKVGVMVRESDAPGAKFADIVLTPDKGAEFQWRTDMNGDTQTSEQTPAPAPYWVKLTRTGDVFAGWISPDGKTWTERGRATIAMGPNVLAGICVTSHKNDTVTKATLNSVTVTAAARP